jgi:short-subunit dehydrogenase
MPDAANSLADRTPVALVTGASSGIGRAIAEALLAAGVSVYGTSRNPNLPGRNPAIQWLAFEGGQAGFVNAFAKDRRDLLTKIDLLVNNAGSGLFGEASQQQADDLQSQIQLLLEAPMALTLAVLPAMRERGRGCIVNVSSLAGEFPLPYLAAYTAAKAGLSGFTQSLMLTEADSGVQLVDFQLGDFRTAFNEAMACPPALTEPEQRVWEHLEKHLREAPPPETAARDLLKAIRRGRTGIVRSGGFFQTRVAPLGLRLLPRACLLWTIRRYYGIAGR